MKIIYLVLICTVSIGEGKKKKSEYTQKDWDRIAREWEREEMEEDERERAEEMKRKPNIQFDPNNIGKINPEQLLAQSKKGKPTMIFFNVREIFCNSEKQLAKITANYASLLLNGNIQVQNYPVSKNRAIFMVQDGSVSYEVKNFLLKQKEVESVTIDQQHWDADGDGTPTYPGEKAAKTKKAAGDKKSDKSKKAHKVPSDNMSENKPELKKEEKKRFESKNTVNLDDELSDEEFQKKFLQEAEQDSKSPKPMTEDTSNNKIPVMNDNGQKVVSENDIKTEL